MYEAGSMTSFALEWRIDDALTDYPDALAAMQARVAAVRAGTAPELVWLVEHPPLYTAGTSAKPEELTDPTRFPSYKAGRGGRGVGGAGGGRPLLLTRPRLQPERGGGEKPTVFPQERAAGGGRGARPGPGPRPPFAVPPPPPPARRGPADGHPLLRQRP